MYSEDYCILCDFSRLVVCDMMPRGRKQYSWEFDNRLIKVYMNMW